MKACAKFEECAAENLGEVSDNKTVFIILISTNAQFSPMKQTGQRES